MNGGSRHEPPRTMASSRPRSGKRTGLAVASPMNPSIEVASARLSLSQTAGMKATRVGFYFAIIGIPTYFEGDFYMKSTGGCDKVNITAGSFLAKPILKLVLPGVIGCPVY